MIQINDREAGNVEKLWGVVKRKRAAFGNEKYQEIKSDKGTSGSINTTIKNCLEMSLKKPADATVA